MIEFVSRTRAAQWTRRRSGKLAVAGAAVVLVTVVALLVVQHLLPADLLNKAVAAGLQRSAGLTAKIDGPTEFRFFLRPRLVIHNIHITDASGALRVDAPEIVGYVRLLPLLAGRIEIGHAVLYQPKFFVALDHAPMSQGGALQHAIKAPAGDVRGLQAPLGMIEIVDGQAQIKTGKAAAAVAFDAINMHFNWPRLAASADFGGDLDFRGVPVRLRGWLEQPLDVLRGSNSASIFQITSPLLTFWSSGHISGAPGLQYNGSISASAPSLRKLAETAGYSFSKNGTFADLDLSCDVDFEGGNAAFTNLALHLDGNDYQGNLEIQDIAHAPHLSGTLASDFLDVTPFMAGLREPAASGALWNHKPLDFQQLDFANLDLRVSAARLRLYDMEVNDAALSLLTRPGSIDLALAEATSNNGAIRGRFELTEKNHLFNLLISGSGSGIDLQPVSFDRQHPLSGSLDASLGLQSAGSNLNALMQGLNGQAALSASNGAFVGVDLVSTLTQSAGRKPGEKLVTVPGTTSFDRLVLDLRIGHGVATINSGQISAPNLQLGVGGGIDIGHRQLNILSLAQIIETAGKSPRATPAQFAIKGPWSAPIFYQASAGLRLPKPVQSKDSLPDTMPPPAQE